MPAKKCIEHNGKTYCWNRETKEAEEIVSKTVEISECPESVLEALINCEYNEDDKIKTLIKAVKDLVEDGYELSHGDIYKDITAISDFGEQYKVRTLKFLLNKRIPLEGGEKELSQLINSLTHSFQED